MKRYPKYKDSGIEWIGEIPEHWVVSKLKYSLDEIIGGGTPDTSNLSYWDDENGIPWVAISDITEQEILKKTSRKISVEGKESKGLEIIPRGTLLISIFASLGKTTLLDIDASVNQAILGLIPAHKLIRDYLKYHLVDVERYISYYSSSNTQENLNLTKIKNLIVLLPPFPEQQSIANYLDRKTHQIDTLIETKQKLIDLLKEQRAAIINQAVTKGLDPNVKLKDSGIEWLGEIPEHWDVKNFRRICRLQQGLQIAQSERFHETGPNRYVYITVKSFHAGDKYDSREYIENPSKRVICEPDDILLARTGATGEVISGLHGAFHNNFFKVEYDKKKVDKTYLIYYLSNVQIKKYLLLMAGTTTVPDLNHGDFLDAPFVAPNISEQQSIVDYLTAQTTRIDKSIEKQERQIKLIKEYRAALISEVATGKIDVRDSEEQEDRDS